MSKKILFSVGVAGSLLLLLPGCGGDKEKNNSLSLLSIDGKTVITEKTFNEYLGQFVEANPRLKPVIENFPDAKYNVFSGMAGEEVLVAWAKKEKIQESEEYKKSYAQALRMIERGLAAKFFNDRVLGDITVSDEDVVAYYETNKDKIPDLMVSAGGIKASGIEFGNKTQAQAFYQKAKGNARAFTQAAKDSGLKIKDFGLVTEHSFDVAQEIKTSLQNQKTCPSVAIVEAGGKSWVIAATEKEARKYRDLKEVETPLKEALKREKVTVAYNQHMEVLKKEYKVEEHKAYFARAETPQEPITPVQQVASAEEAAAPAVEVAEQSSGDSKPVIA